MLRPYICSPFGVVRDPNGELSDDFPCFILIFKGPIKVVLQWTELPLRDHNNDIQTQQPTVLVKQPNREDSSGAIYDLQE